MLTLRPATAEEIPWIMGVEADPAYAPYIVSWERERHEQALADPRFRYRVAVTEQIPRAGFAILILDQPAPGQVYLQRLAILAPGQGLGRRFMDGLCQELFADPAHPRLWLHVFPDNLRGLGFYQALGFQRAPEGDKPLHHHGRCREALAMELTATAFFQKILSES